VGKYCCWGLTFGVVLTLGALLAACGGDDSGNAGPVPSISIENPTSAPSYYTTSTGLMLGGTISRASYVHVRNARTGFTTDGYVNYYQGQGSWFADVRGLEPGDNPITATADADGFGTSTASATITVTRPLQPATLMINGDTQASTNTYWIDTSGFAGSHKIALFKDGTGRATTGNVISENAGPVMDFTWSMTGPDSVLISNCPTCSFQRLTRISGSLGEGLCFAQVETIGGAGEIAIHGFSLASGQL
jgi:hypothetical protein